MYHVEYYRQVISDQEDLFLVYLIHFLNVNIEEDSNEDFEEKGVVNLSALSAVFKMLVELRITGKDAKKNEENIKKKLKSAPVNSVTFISIIPFSKQLVMSLDDNNNKETPEVFNRGSATTPSADYKILSEGGISPPSSTRHLGSAKSPFVKSTSTSTSTISKVGVIGKAISKAFSSKVSPSVDEKKKKKGSVDILLYCAQDITNPLSERIKYGYNHISNSYAVLWLGRKGEVPTSSLLVQIINNTIANTYDSEILIIGFPNEGLLQAAQLCFSKDPDLFDDIECEFLHSRLFLGISFFYL